MNKELGIENEIRALLNNFWIVKEENIDLYYNIKRKQNIIKEYVVKNLGSHLIIHDNFIKLEKIPTSLSSNQGIDDFQTPMDYVFLCLLLLYLEDKPKGEIFVLSSLIDYVKNTAITMQLDNIPNWDLAKDRRSFVRALDFLVRIHVIKIKDEEKTSFKDDQNAEALYVATGLSNYVMKIFNQNIFDFQNPEDFIKEEWSNQNEEKGDIRRYKVYRNLLYLPASFSTELSLSELDYIKKLRGHMKEELNNLGYELEVTRNLAFLYEYETNPSKENFPNNKNITNIVLLVNRKLYEMIQNKKIILDEYEVGKIPKESLEMILKEIKINASEYLSKHYKDLPLTNFMNEVLDYMIHYAFIKEQDGIYQIMPSIARFQAKITKNETNQLDLFGGNNDVESE